LAILHFAESFAENIVAWITGVERILAIDKFVRTGCRGRPLAGGNGPHTLFDPNVLIFLATAMNRRTPFCFP